MSSYLTNKQFHYINQEINKGNGKPYRELLFHHSLPYARSMYFKFCQKSRHAKKMTYKQKQDLLYYGYGGLWKAACNYNGKNNFYRYASFYIDGELKRGVSDQFTSCILPHRYRVDKKYMESNDMSKTFVTSFSQIGKEYGNNIPTMEESYQHTSNLESIIRNLPTKDRLYITLRYEVYSCEVQRSYKEVSRLMKVSEETARKEVRRIMADIISAY